MTETKSQLGKFKQAARGTECDESEAHWDEKLKKVVEARVPASGRLEE